MRLRAEGNPGRVAASRGDRGDMAIEKAAHDVYNRSGWKDRC